MHRAEYGTSAGVIVKDRGPYNATPVNNYLSGDGKSHVYKGPHYYYIPSEQKWIPLSEYRSLPPETKRDAILFESEDEWRKFQRMRDAPYKPGGISMSGKPEEYTGVPVPALLPFQTHAWNRQWSGAGYFLPSGNKWFHDQVSPGIPRESLKFYNEEDWLKFKYMVEKPGVSTAAYLGTK